MRVPLLSLTAAISLSLIGIAQGQSSNPAAGRPGVVTGGSSSVTVNGKPAARQGDTTTDGALVEGVPNVFINGKPATVIGNRTGCGGSVTSGSHGVSVNGKPMARHGDQTSGCPK
jgi:uncharacterized Zn-binding protein involved in type VI secretion